MSDRLPAARPEPRRWSVLLLASPLLLTGLPARPEPVVRAERIELVNPQGERRAVLAAADSGAVFLTLLDPQGRPLSTLRLDGRPWLAVQDSRGREAAGLGAARAHELTD